jgi:Bacterial regulatory protein, Fis family
MTDELIQREVVRKPQQAEGGFALRLLDAVLRLRAAGDERALGSAAAEALGALLGSAPAAIRIVHELAVSRRLGTGAAAEGVESLMDRAAVEGLPVLDGPPPRGIALPIQGAGRPVGAIYVAHPGVVTHGGIELDLLKVLAAHLGAASIDLSKRETPEDPVLAAGAAPKSLSLHDAKLAFERRLLHLRLTEAKGNVAAAARALDMDRGQLSRLMRKHRIDRTEFRARP